jgi:hypothetical protein
MQSRQKRSLTMPRNKPRATHRGPYRRERGTTSTLADDDSGGT